MTRRGSVRRLLSGTLFYQRQPRRRQPWHSAGITPYGIEHKSDIDGVKIGLASAAAVQAAYAEVVSAGLEAGADVQDALITWRT